MKDSAGRQKRYYPKGTTKHAGNKTEAELAEIRERYKAPLTEEFIEHIAGKLADKFIEEGKCGEIMGED